VERAELLDIDARLAHMDELGVDIQVLYPTLFLRPVTTRAEVEAALYKSLQTAGSPTSGPKGGADCAGRCSRRR